MTVLSSDATSKLTKVTCDIAGFSLKKQNFSRNGLIKYYFWRYRSNFLRGNPQAQAHWVIMLVLLTLSSVATIPA